MDPKWSQDEAKINAKMGPRGRIEGPREAKMELKWSQDEAKSTDVQELPFLISNRIKINEDTVMHIQMSINIILNVNCNTSSNVDMILHSI